VDEKVKAGLAQRLQEFPVADITLDEGEGFFLAFKFSNILAAAVREIIKH
jgi:hypothetical protein